MKAPYFDKNGKKTKEVTLPKEVFDADVYKKVVAQAVRVHLTNKRQGTRSTKGRSDLHYSGRKIWRQKGTGRARHGDRTPGLFVKGAKSHGPKPRNFSARLPKKMKSRALTSVLTKAAKDKRVGVIEEFKLGKTRLTNSAEKLVKKMKLGRVLLVADKIEENLIKATSNLENVSVKAASDLNAYDAGKKRYLLFTKDGIEAIQKRVTGKAESKQETPKKKKTKSKSK